MGESAGRRQSEARDFWDAAIRLWEESGLSVRDFCRREGLGEHSFHSWRGKLPSESSSPEAAAQVSATADVETISNARRQRRKRRRLSRPTSPEVSAVTFMPVRVLADEVIIPPSTAPSVHAADTRIEIVSDSTWRVRIPNGFDPATLDAVVTVLERRPC